MESKITEPKSLIQEKIDLSIIIINWNTKQLLLGCLDSLSAQKRDNKYEIIIVDNGSTDGSQDAVKKEYPSVRLVENERNLGFAKANNIGIRVSSGRYICLVNSDVKVLDGSIDLLCEYMDQNPDVGMTGPKLLYPDLRLQDSCRSFPSLWNNFCSSFFLSRIFPKSKFFSSEHMRYFAHDKICKVDYLAGAFLAVKRAAIDQVGLLDEKFFIYSEEVDWCKRFWKAGWEVVFFPESRAIHFIRGSSSRQPIRFALEQQRARLQYWDKHHGLMARFTLRLILGFECLIKAIAASLLFLVYILWPSTRSLVFAKIVKHLKCFGLLVSLNPQVSLHE